MNVKRTAAAAALVLCLVAPVAAETVTLDLINEYPATSLPGEADAFFAEAVKRRTDGRVVIQPIPDAKSGLRTREQIKAVAEGRFAMADSFGGALGDESPVFLLSSLPFVTRSADDAQALYAAARPLYEKLFADRRQKLLYVVPWPASGIWSAAPVNSTDALKALKIRTYDKTGTEVFAKVATSATVVSFADLNGRLEAGDITAVLSSGDGGAGRQLWKFLRHFSEIGYAAPLSFTAISLDVWERLDAPARAALEEAARETTARQWTVLAGRLSENYARMRTNGVTIDERPPADVMEALRAAAAATVSAWLAGVGPEARKIFEDYRTARGR